MTLFVQLLQVFSTYFQPLSGRRLICGQARAEMCPMVDIEQNARFGFALGAPFVVWFAGLLYEDHNSVEQRRRGEGAAHSFAPFSGNDFARTHLCAGG